MASSSSDRVRRLAWLLYAVAVLFITGPVMEVVSTAWPIRPGDFQWRFGAVGLLTQGASVMVLGALAILIATTLLDHRGMQRLFTILAGLASLTLAVAVVFFALDALELRQRVRPEAAHLFDLSAAKTFAILSYATIVIVAMTVLAAKLAWSRKRSADAQLLPTAAALRGQSDSAS